MTNTKHPYASLKDKVAVITGGSRGIGRALALGLAQHGVHVVIAAKSTQSRERLPGSIHSVAEEIKASGGDALGVQVDVRRDEDVEALRMAVKERYGTVDILIHNAGALWWRPVTDTTMKRFDLVMDVNVRGGFLLTSTFLPIMNSGGHILMLSPPIDLKALPGRVAYLISKFGMTLLALGLAEELRPRNIASNALWPVTAIESQATINHKIGDKRMWRKPDILVDAVLEIAASPPGTLTGQMLLDEDFLRTRGWTDFTGYRCDPDHEPPRMTVDQLPRS